jgi:hypothetical protein
MLDLAASNSFASNSFAQGHALAIAGSAENGRELTPCRIVKN